MSDLWKKIIGQAKQVSLTKEEKFSILEAVRQRMDNPAVEPVMMTSKIETPYFSKFSFSFTWHEKRFVPVAVVLIVVVFSGTAFAANKALPGDALYSMKVNVNEKVESWGALSPNALARFEAVRAERRLKELEKVTVQKKKISPEVKAEVRENIDKNIQKVKEITAEIAASGDAEDAASVKAELESKLEAHSVVLGKLATDDEVEKITEVSDEDKANIKDINDLVDAHINELKIEAEKEESTDAQEDTKEEVKDEVRTEETSSVTENITDIDESGTTITDIPPTVATSTLESEPSIEQFNIDTKVQEEKEPKDLKETIKEEKDRKSDTKNTKKDAKNKLDESNEKQDKEQKIKDEVKSILQDLNLSVDE